MKTVLVIAAMVGVSASAAWAHCPGHQVNASAEVDREMITASITKTSRVPPPDAVEQVPPAVKDRQDTSQQ